MIRSSSLISLKSGTIRRAGFNFRSFKTLLLRCTLRKIANVQSLQSVVLPFQGELEGVLSLGNAFFEMTVNLQSSQSETLLLKEELEEVFS